MARRKISKFITVIVAAALYGCTTGAGPTAPPLEQLAMLPMQIIALPFMMLKPFAPLIEAGMQAGIQMAPYALLFCQKDAGPSEFMLAAYPGREEADLPLSLPLIEAYLAEEEGIERIVAVDLEGIGGIDNLQLLLSAMEENGISCRYIIADAGDIICDDGSLYRLRDLLLERGVSLCTTGRLSTAVSDRLDASYIGFETESEISRAWHRIAMVE